MVARWDEVGLFLYKFGNLHGEIVDSELQGICTWPKGRDLSLLLEGERSFDRGEEVCRNGNADLTMN